MNYAFNLLKQNTTLALIMIIACVLRFYHLQFQSVWDDEIATMIVSNPSLTLREMYYEYKTFDNMPPLYFVVLRCVFYIFGYNDQILRVFSAIGGVAGVYAIYLLGKELHNKRTGLFAALMLTVNQMHLHYSQEGRPYSYLVCFTLLSFYALIRLTKNPTWLNSVLYGVFTALMIYSQYIALIIVPAQGLLFLFFLYKSPREKRIRLFLRMVFSAILVVVLYTPAYFQLFTNLKIESSWIPAPGPEPYTAILKEFFGHSEMVLTLVYLLLIFFFVRLFTEKEAPETTTEVKFETLRYNFLILGVWIATCTLVPLLRSYLVVPMIIPRYFIHLAPAVILLLALGLNQVQNQLSRRFILGIFLIFNLSDVLVIKDFYNRVTKPQYTQNANFIKEHRQPGEPVVARVGWHYGYYFPDSVLVWASLENYILNQLNDSNRVKSFWYAGVHDQTIPLSDQTRAFLEKNYYRENSKDQHATQAIHFERKDKKTIYPDLKTFSPVAADGNNILTLNNTPSTAASLYLPKGTYRMTIVGRSFPEEPIHNINAHISVKINDKFAGGFFLQPSIFTSNDLYFNIKEDSTVSLQLSFDNDFIHEKQDRYAQLLAISIKKEGSLP